MNSVSEAPKMRLPMFLQQGSAIPPNITLAGPSVIDQYARVVFPLTFALFNIIYWYIYLSKDTVEKFRCVFILSVSVSVLCSIYLYIYIYPDSNR